MILTIFGAFIGALLGGAISYFISKHFYKRNVKDQKLPGKIEGSVHTTVDPYMIDTTMAQREQVASVVHNSAEEIAQVVSSVMILRGEK